MPKLIECIPNFSVSEQVDPVVFQGLVDTANAVAGCTLLNTHTDGDHNRCVLTVIGSPDAIEEVAFRLCKKATETILSRLPMVILSLHYKNGYNLTSPHKPER